MTPLDSIDWGTQVSNSISVYFAPPGATYDGVTSLGWTQYEIDRAMAAFQTWADVANLTFTITTNPNTATFKLVTTTSNEFLGYFNPPGTFNAGVGVFAVNGDGWDTTGGLEAGGYGFVTLVHEFGHGLGLAHPHDNGGTSTIMTGVSGPFGDYGSFDLNQGVYTVMSYNDGWQTGPSGLSSSVNYGWEAGPGALDIAVIQAKYGAASANTGDNVYNLPTSNAAGTFWDVIYDTGGNDTIAYSGTVTAHIDLTAATLDYSATGGGVISYANGILGGFTIAAGVVIENASGGSGADILIGNSAANVITGGGGNDTIEGRAGNDTLTGNAGNDIFVFASDGGNDTVTDLAAGDIAKVSGFSSAQSIVQDGADVVVTLSASQQIVFQNTTVATVQSALQFLSTGPSEGNDTLVGTAANDTINGLGGNDTISGLAGNDTLDGGSGNDIIDGGIGNDVMRGGPGDDTFYVDNRRDVVTELAGAGTDKVFASATYTLAANVENGELLGAAVINLTGNTLNNELIGNSAANILSGTAGNDILDGLGGNDTLTGGTGVDTFRYSAGGGQDTVKDLAVGETVEISGYSSAQSVLQSGKSVVVTLSGTDRITLSNTTVAKVQAALHFESDGSINGTAGDDNLNGTSGDDTINGLGGNDEIVGNGGNDTIDGGDGDDSLLGGLGDDTIYGGNGNDFIWGDFEDTSNGGNDVIFGGEGDDYLRGGLGDDYLDGGTGWDRLSYAVEGTGGVIVDLNLQGVAQNTGKGWDTLVGIEHVSGSDADDTLIGNEGDNWLWGIGGNDSISGNGGNDLIEVGHGDHTLDGGSGTDTLSVKGDSINNTGPFAIDLSLQGAGQNTGQGTFDLSGFENLSGSVHADSLTGDSGGNWIGGDQGDDVIYGGDGNDMLYGDGRAWVSLEGGGGAITFYSDISQVDPSLVGGSDTIEGGSGNDTIGGGGGNDELSGGTGNDTLTGGVGTDTFNFAAGDGQDIVTDLAPGERVQITGYGSAQSITQNGADVVLVLSGTDQITFQNTTVATVQATLQFDSGGGGDGQTYTNPTGTFQATSGDDTFIFNQPPTALVSADGAAGSDVLSVDFTSSTPMDFRAAASNAGFSGWAKTGPYDPAILFWNVEDAEFVGSTFNDSFYLGIGSNSSGLVANFDGAGGVDALEFDFRGLTTGQVFQVNSGIITSSFGAFANIEQFTIYAGSGNDAIRTGDYNDSVYTGRGSDTVETGVGDDYIYSESSGGSIDGGTGYDYYVGNLSGYNYYTGSTIANTTPFVVDFGSTIQVSTGITVTNVESGQISTGSGNDQFNVTVDTGMAVDGGAGFDTVIYDAAATHGLEFSFHPEAGMLWGNAGSFAFGSIERIELHGTDFNDSFVIGSYPDQVYAAEGVLLDGGGGSDSLEADFRYFTDGSSLVVALDGSITSNRGEFHSFETFTLTGGDQADFFTTGAGNDTLFGEAGNDGLNGGDGNDALWGGAGADTLVGGAGNDSLYGYDYGVSPITPIVDTLMGGLGDDYYFEKDEVNNIVEYGGEGFDTVATTVNYILPENVEALILLGYADSPFGMIATTGTGNSGDNVITGNEINNTLDGGVGNDILTGGDGTDTFKFALGDGKDTITDLTAGESVQIDGYDSAQSIVQNGTDVVVTLSATDTITFSNSDVATVQAALQFGEPLNTITGTSAADTISGTSGDDAIDGLGGNDKISGLEGNDRIDGGAGGDILIGGDGADIFEFEASPGNDRITDFQSGTDKLDLSAFGITSSDVSTQLDHSNTVVSVDTNHDGNADFTIALIGVGSVAPGDYIFG